MTFPSVTGHVTRWRPRKITTEPKRCCHVATSQLPCGHSTRRYSHVRGDAGVNRPTALPVVRKNQKTVAQGAGGLVMTTSSCVTGSHVYYTINGRLRVFSFYSYKTVCCKIACSNTTRVSPVSSIASFSLGLGLTSRWFVQ